MNRKQLADLIYQKLNQQKDQIFKSYRESRSSIGFFTVDNLLPEKIVHEIYKSFPSSRQMRTKKSIREFKHVGVQMDKYEKILEEITYAFQDQRILDFLKKTCETPQLFPDEMLYAGGLSLMKKGNFLNPHLDNSHDNERKKRRAFNLLFYVTPDWEQEYGGNLEIWQMGIKHKQTTIHSKFNRLIVMETHQKSWHSVSPVIHDGARCCISNYFFSETPSLKNDSFHVTTFRGRPKHKLTNILLKMDSSLRKGIRRLWSKGIVKTNHIYKKQRSDKNGTNKL